MCALSVASYDSSDDAACLSGKCRRDTVRCVECTRTRTRSSTLWRGGVCVCGDVGVLEFAVRCASAADWMMRGSGGVGDVRMTLRWWCSMRCVYVGVGVVVGRGSYYCCKPGVGQCSSCESGSGTCDGCNSGFVLDPDTSTCLGEKVRPRFRRARRLSMVSRVLQSGPKW